MRNEVPLGIGTPLSMFARKYNLSLLMRGIMAPERKESTPRIVGVSSSWETACIVPCRWSVHTKSVSIRDLHRSGEVMACREKREPNRVSDLLVSPALLPTSQDVIIASTYRAAAGRSVMHW